MEEAGGARLLARHRRARDPGRTETLNYLRTKTIADGAGLKARRGGATKLDPTLAAAQLRAALYGPAAYTAGILTIDAREALAMATRLRGALDERDLALLHIAEALNADPPDYAAAVTRAQEAAARYPLDVEVGAQLASLLPLVGKLDDGRAQFNHLLEHGPLEEREAAIRDTREGERADAGPRLRALDPAGVESRKDVNRVDGGAPAARRPGCERPRPARVEERRNQDLAGRLESARRRLREPRIAAVGGDVFG